jgi:hypothetical protein
VSGADSWIVGVWLQNPVNAARFRDAGIDLFVGLWNGPTDEQLTTLGRAAMPVITQQTGVWKTHTSDATTRGWLAPDQPDNAQLQMDGTFGRCISPNEALAARRAGTPRRPARSPSKSKRRAVLNETALRAVPLGA